jgi:G:T-mismatch repair DNA endonuclease (very short patch repair protein)
LFLAWLSQARDVAGTSRGMVRRKIEGNKTRDRLVNRTLRRAGWKVVRIWEHQLQSLKSKVQRLKSGPDEVLKQIKRALNR